MLVVLSLTLKEAASTLGLQPGASAAEVNAAYRKLIAKYHPDANRTKSETEQKQAEMMFKKVGEARKIMLKPETAAPDSSDYSPASPSGTSSQPRPQTYRSSVPTNTSTRRSGNASANSRVSSPRATSASYQTSAASSQYSPSGYNKATTFQSDIPKVPDPAEDSLTQIYDNETRKAYRKLSDKVRITPSIIVTVVFLVYAMFSVFTDPRGFQALSAANPNLIMASICLLKAIYDVFISYYVHEKLLKKFSLGWLAQCGMGTVVMAITYLLMSSSAKSATDVGDIAVNATNIVAGGNVATAANASSESMLVMGIAILVGVGMCAINFFVNKKKQEKSNQGRQ